MSEVTRLNEQELKASIPDSASWHNDYKDTAWIRVRGLSYDLSEGDLICVFSQFGEVEDIKLIRNVENGRSTGLCFIKFERAKSAWLTVDNFNQTTLQGRVIQVDHHREVFRRGKRHEGKSFEELMQEVAPGAYYREKELQGKFTLDRGVDVYEKKTDKPSTWRAVGRKEETLQLVYSGEEEDEDDRAKRRKAKKESKKDRKEKKTKKHKRDRLDSE